jgi:signal transduction histidine kinase
VSFLSIHRRAILIGAIFMAVVVAITILIYVSLERWRRDVIRTNETLTTVVAEQLLSASRGLVDSLEAEHVFARRVLTTDEVQILDDRLKSLSDTVFSRIHGIEGGFFLIALDEFYGYAYPTSPPPIPVYGPPPRSYNFIKTQIMETIDSAAPIVRLHRFDPAIFPLATEPVMVGDRIVAVVWARIHIERELPAIKLKEVINVGAVTSLLGFVIALLVSISQRRKILKMSLELENVKSGKALQITAGPGTLGVIAHSINAMIKTMREENHRREQLERRLHQRDKMASLGKVIAGVAHEVKTPLAIIKTRIQMWQQSLRDDQRRSQTPQVFSNDALQLVVDEVDRLSDLVKHLLLFSKPQPTTMGPVDVNDLLKQTVTFSTPPGNGKQIEFVQELDGHLPAVAADRNALRQVFMNVLVNAIEAIHERGTIAVSTRYDAKRRLCLVFIRDNGVGIPETVRQSVFDPFVTTKKKGFGLGLSISYEIITAHGGAIQLVRNDTGGTTCIIELPISQPEQGSKHETD